MVNRLKRLFPRSTGSQWKIPKIHEQMHIAYNIHLYGSHQNIHTGPQEHNHIENTKKPSRCTQKRKYTFDHQLGTCLAEKYVVVYTQNQIKCQQSNLKVPSLSFKSLKEARTKCTQMASKFEVHMKCDLCTNSINVEYQWITKSKNKQELSQALLKLIVTHFMHPLPKLQQLNGITVFCLTKYSCEGQTY